MKVAAFVSFKFNADDFLSPRRVEPIHALNTWLRGKIERQLVKTSTHVIAHSNPQMTARRNPVDNMPCARLDGAQSINRIDSFAPLNHVHIWTAALALGSPNPLFPFPYNGLLLYGL